MTWKSKQVKGVQLNGKSGRIKLKNNFEGNENWWVKYDVLNQIISKVFKNFSEGLLSSWQNVELGTWNSVLRHFKFWVRSSNLTQTADIRSSFESCVLKFNWDRTYIKNTKGTIICLPFLKNRKNVMVVIILFFIAKSCQNREVSYIFGKRWSFRFVWCFC